MFLLLQNTTDNIISSPKIVENLFFFRDLFFDTITTLIQVLMKFFQLEKNPF